MVIFTEKQSLPLKLPLGEMDWWLKGEITRLFITKMFEARENEILLFTSEKFKKNKNFLLFGTGSLTNFDTLQGELILSRLKDQLTSLNVRNFLFVPSANISKELPVIKKHLRFFSYDVFV